VLGDVVCGGFAAPLRIGLADKVLIVVSEENMALYAANNISRAIITYQNNGIRLGGFIANLKSKGPDAPEHVKRFAKLLGAGILGVVPKSPLIIKSDFKGKTLMESYPDSEEAAIFRNIADSIIELGEDNTTIPTPIEPKLFIKLSKRLFKTTE